MDNILDQPQSTNNQRTIDDVLTNGYQLSIGDAFNRGVDIWKKNIGGFLLYCLLALAAAIVIGLIPFIGSVASSFIIGPAMAAGYYLVSNKLSFFGAATQQDYTAGFKKMGDNALFVLIKFASVVVIFIPVIIVAFGTIIQLIALSKGGGLKDPDTIKELITLIMPIVGVVALCSIVALLVQLLFIFVYPLIHIYDLSAIDAVKASAKTVLKNYLTFLLLIIVIALVNFAGMLCLGIGLLFTIPLSYCVIYAAYEIVFENKPTA